MTLRLPAPMHDEIRRLAEREDRPITDQIVRLLRLALELEQMKEPPQQGGGSKGPTKPN